MTALLRAETRRLLSRTLMRVMMLVVLGVLALAVFAVAGKSHPHTPASLARAKAFVASQRAGNLQDCLAQAAAGVAPPPGQAPVTAAECREQARRFRPSLGQFQGYQFSFRTQSGSFMFLFGGLLALFGFLVGASFVGAEWSSGGMMTLLVWQPRRVRLLLAKLSALLIGIASFVVLSSVAWLTALWLVSRLRGDASPLTPNLAASLGLAGARVLALTLAFAVAGFAIASFGRHTSAALGVAVGYIVVFEVVLRLILSSLRIARPQRFLLSSYVFAWLNKAAHYPGAGPARPWSIHMGQGAALMAVIVTTALGTSIIAIHRRDVA